MALADSSVMAKWCGIANSDEEVAYGAAKSGKLRKILDDILLAESDRVVIGSPKNDDLASLWENHPHQRDTRSRYSATFFMIPADSVSRRDHFDGQIRRHRRQFVADLSAGPACVAVIADIRPAHRVWVALGQTAESFDKAYP